MGRRHREQTEDDGLHDPIVIEPEGFDLKANWAECAEAAKHVQRPDGEMSWKAAFSADPGVVSCPCCQRMHWAWGAVQRCTKCGFEYPVGWWCQYAWGVHAANRGDKTSKTHLKSMSDPYYRYGYEHPVEEPWDERTKVDWRAVMGQPLKEGNDDAGTPA